MTHHIFRFVRVEFAFLGALGYVTTTFGIVLTFAILVAHCVIATFMAVVERAVCSSITHIIFQFLALILCLHFGIRRIYYNSVFFTTTLVVALSSSKLA